MRLSRASAVLAILTLYLLHNNWWSWQPDFTLLFGSIPFELVYRILWVLVSTGVLWLVMRGWWRQSE